jgi:hypothetical protein
VRPRAASCSSPVSVSPAGRNLNKCAKNENRREFSKITVLPTEAVVGGSRNLPGQETGQEESSTSTSHLQKPRHLKPVTTGLNSSVLTTTRLTALLLPGEAPSDNDNPTCPPQATGQDPAACSEWTSTGRPVLECQVCATCSEPSVVPRHLCDEVQTPCGTREHLPQDIC